ncbi:hypothetical protein DACRYDRAFT_111764 [Dacryopinax primogenitus]|uniref:Extracellular mutant protein 11 C-terminal domain-containing protein n=1 Tax=Dacryopinax primogenitus (strain DJM 731) TaxID=1858805 RepID=M5G1V0_DACPD|nr:uncharacterized protein DACRYDRAFT_111764 [Dacryopinax primogenitus]EJT97717.1 hypothetical protein DACRYDRAFT_111764 [Dacryopinax primogenitus]
MSTVKPPVTKPFLPALGMGPRPSRTSSKPGVPPTPATSTTKLHHPTPRSTMGNLFSTASRASTPAIGRSLSSISDMTMVNNDTAADFNPLPLNSFMKNNEPLANPQIPRPHTRAGVRADLAGDTNSPVLSSARRAKTPAPFRPNEDKRIHEPPAHNLPSIATENVVDPSLLSVSHDTESFVDQISKTGPSNWQAPPAGFSWVGEMKARGPNPHPAPPSAPPPGPPPSLRPPVQTPVSNRSHVHEDIDMTLVDDEIPEEYVIPLSDKMNGKPTMERQGKGKRSDGHISEIKRKRRPSPLAPQPQTARPNAARLPLREIHSHGRPVYDEREESYYDEVEQMVTERPMKRTRPDNRPVSPSANDSTNIHQSSQYEHLDDAYYQLESMLPPVPSMHSNPSAQQYSSYQDYQDSYEHDLPLHSEGDTEQLEPTPSTPPPPPTKNNYDVQAYLNRNMYRYEALQQKWRECTHEEWVDGAKELVAQFEKTLSLVKDHMQKKIELFTSLHLDLDNHCKLLDDRDERLRGAQDNLAQGAVTVVGSRTNPIVV